MLTLFGSDEGDGHAVGADTAGAADAVDVILRVQRQIAAVNSGIVRKATEMRGVDEDCLIPTVDVNPGKEKDKENANSRNTGKVENVSQ